MRLTTIWITSMILISFLCNAQELRPKIATDMSDERIPYLLGEWYLKSSKVESTTFNFMREINDSTDLKMNFNENGNFVLKNRHNKENPTKTGLWFLVDDNLYLETYAEKGLCNVYTINGISDTLLSYTYYKTKNIYESSLCGDERVYTIREFPAKYGKSVNDFENYFTINMKLYEQIDSINFGCTIEFVINCEGEICNVRQSCDKNTEIGTIIVMLLRQMPKWTPAKKQNKAVNSRKKYFFSYNNGQIRINEDEY